MSANSGDHRVVDEVHRISGTRVFGDGVVIVIWNARYRIEDDILKHAAEAQRIPDLRLIRLREPDALGIAAAFEVEDAARAPAVLIVANQATRWVCRKCGFASA